MKKKRPFVHVDIGFLADDVGETATNTLDGSEGKHDLLLSIDVGVEHTKNVLKLLVCNKRLQKNQFINIKTKHNHYMNENKSTHHD